MAELRRSLSSLSGSTLNGDNNGEGSSSQLETPSISEQYELANIHTQDAHAAELAGDCRASFNLHSRAGDLFSKIISGGDHGSEERRKAKLQIRVTKARRELLRSAAGGSGPPPTALPSRSTAELEIVNSPATVFLSLVEAGIWDSLSSQECHHEIVNDPATGTPFLTPMLSPHMPPVIHHVYLERVKRNDLWVYFHITDESKAHTLYTLAGSRCSWDQFKGCTLSRASEYHDTCAQISIGTVKALHTPIESANLGRKLTISLAGGAGTTVVTVPDRLDRAWTPRRFTYGGRRFVWKPYKNGGLSNMTEALYEVKREWPVPSSKTGKKDDETFDKPLLKADSKLSADKVAVIWMVGGLDQFFREFLIASIMTRYMIGMYGHC